MKIVCWQYLYLFIYVQIYYVQVISAFQPMCPDSTYRSEIFLKAFCM